MFLRLLSSGFSWYFTPYLLSYTPYKGGETRSWQKKDNICWRQLNARYDTRSRQSLCFCIRGNMSIRSWGRGCLPQVSFFYKHITYQFKNVERPHKFRPSPHPQVEPLCNLIVVQIGGFQMLKSILLTLAALRWRFSFLIPRVTYGWCTRWCNITRVDDVSQFLTKQPASCCRQL